MMSIPWLAMVVLSFFLLGVGMTTSLAPSCRTYSSLLILTSIISSSTSFSWLLPISLDSMRGSLIFPAVYLVTFSTRISRHILLYICSYMKSNVTPTLVLVDSLIPVACLSLSSGMLTFEAPSMSR